MPPWLIPLPIPLPIPLLMPLATLLVLMLLVTPWPPVPLPPALGGPVIGTGRG